MGSNEVLEKINRRVGEPRDLEIQRRFAVDQVVRNTARDVLWVKNQVPDHPPDFLRYGAVHNIPLVRNSRFRWNLPVHSTRPVARDASAGPIQLAALWASSRCIPVSTNDRPGNWPATLRRRCPAPPANIEP